jgi:predicted metal-dependent hydrolase
MNYEIVYCKRRSVGLKIQNGILTIRAPYGTPKKYIAGVVEKHRAWINKAMKREAAKRELYENLSDDDVKALRKKARAYFTEKCEYYSGLMGVSYKRLSITGAKTRFGSCSSSGTISFSYRIMLYPEAAWEYVAVHELAHLILMDHSPQFYAIIEKYLPDYKERKKLLKLKGEE